MRKSTLFAMAIIGLACGAMLLLLDFYTGQFKEEIAHAKEMTTEFKESLVPDTMIKLARVRGGSGYVVHDEGRPGLLVDAFPAQALWERDPSGFGFARPLALRLFDAYGADRPVRWIQFRLRRPDGTLLPIFGLEPGEGGGLAVVEGDLPTPPAPPPTKPVPPSPAPGPGGPVPGK